MGQRATDELALLILATQNDRPELVGLILEYKADVMHIDLNHCNALQFAIPAEACHTKVKRAMALQPKREENVGKLPNVAERSKSQYSFLR